MDVFQPGTYSDSLRVRLQCSQRADVVGDLLSIGIYSQEPKTAFQKVAQQIFFGSESVKCELYRNSTTSTPVPVPDSDWLASDKAFARFDLEGADALLISGPHVLLSGDPVLVDFRLVGVRCNRGLAFQYEGFMKLSLELYDLILFPDGSWRRAALVLPQKTQSDCDSLFLSACDVTNGGVEDASMYLELGWASAGQCMMQYHREIREFIVDFMRMYAAFHWRVSTAHTFGPGESRLFAEPDALYKLEPSLDNPVRFRDFLNNGNDCIRAFFKRLDLDAIQRIQAVSPDFVRATLLRTPSHAPEVRTHDFGVNGFALCANPLVSLWRAYEHLYNACLAAS